MVFCEISKLNHCLKQDPTRYVAQSEASFDEKIRAAARQVLERSDLAPVVLLSGPSGSGKTTSALKITHLLNEWGCKAQTISMDNYFFGRDQGSFPLDDEGNIDLESPLRLDVGLLSDHLEKIANCVPVEIPSFDFARQQRCEPVATFCRSPGELILFEGIHALNPEVVGSAMKFSTGIYVSVRTRVTGDNGLVLHPEKIRLLRRLLRDSLYRGQAYTDTINRLHSVSRGEQLYIMPHKHRAAIDIDTFLDYEPAVYCGELRDGFSALDDAFLDSAGLLDVKEFLGQSATLPLAHVPRASLLREFVGEG